MFIKYSIPLVAMTKKNHQRILTKVNKETGKKHSFVAPSEYFTSFQNKCGWFIKPLPEKPISDPVNIKYTFYMDTMRRVDITNLFNAMDDVLVHYDVLEDDNCKIVVAHDGSRVYYDKENPRIEIEITDTEPTFIKSTPVKKPRKKVSKEVV